MASSQGSDKVIQFTPSISTSAVASGRQLSTATQLSNVFASDQPGRGETVIVSSCMVRDKGSISKDFRILLFNADPSLTTTFNQSVGVPASLAGNFVADISVGEGGTWNTAFANFTTIEEEDQNPMIGRGATKDLWAVLQSSEAQTHNASTNLVIDIGFMRNE